MFSNSRAPADSHITTWAWVWFFLYRTWNVAWASHDFSTFATSFVPAFQHQISHRLATPVTPRCMKTALLFLGYHCEVPTCLAPGAHIKFCPSCRVGFPESKPLHSKSFASWQASTSSADKSEKAYLSSSLEYARLKANFKGSPPQGSRCLVWVPGHSPVHHPCFARSHVRLTGRRGPSPRLVHRRRRLSRSFAPQSFFPSGPVIIDLTPSATPPSPTAPEPSSHSPRRRRQSLSPSRRSVAARSRSLSSSSSSSDSSDSSDSSESSGHSSESLVEFPVQPIRPSLNVRQARRSAPTPRYRSPLHLPLHPALHLSHAGLSLRLSRPSLFPHAEDPSEAGPVLPRQSRASCRLLWSPRLDRDPYLAPAPSPGPHVHTLRPRTPSLHHPLPGNPPRQSLPLGARRLRRFQRPRFLRLPAIRVRPSVRHWLLVDPSINQSRHNDRVFWFRAVVDFVTALARSRTLTVARLKRALNKALAAHASPGSLCPPLRFRSKNRPRCRRRPSSRNMLLMSRLQFRPPTLLHGPMMIRCLSHGWAPPVDLSTAAGSSFWTPFR